ncbi:hypothetical protein VTN02DRAFT_4440 [Thermoascus thermophilus]
MSHLSPLPTATPSVPQHCEPSSPLLAAISSLLHTCIPTNLALLSSLLGSFSIVSWLFAQLPQIYKNYRLQSTSGLSIFFLVEWCMGDASNLLGSIFSKQATWQIIIATYYVLVDITLVFQHFWYTYYKAWRQKGKNGLYGTDHGDGGSPFRDAEFLEGVSLACDETVRQINPFAAITGTTEHKDEGSQKKGLPLDSSESRSVSSSNENEKFGSSKRCATRTRSGSSILPTVSPKTVLLASMLCAVLANASPTPGPVSAIASDPVKDVTDTVIKIAGKILSWMSTVFYLGSRLPQLYKNYERKSTAGLSPLLFLAAFSGNFFYSASLLTNPNAWHDLPPHGGGGWADHDGNNRIDWIQRTIPFFLGAAGVLGLDFLVVVQVLMYGDGPQAVAQQVVQVVETVGDEGASRLGVVHSRLIKVTGWMRGWIPSVSPEQRAALQEDQERQALLTEERDRDRYGAV